VTLLDNCSGVDAPFEGFRSLVDKCGLCGQRRWRPLGMILDTDENFGDNRYR